MKKHNAFLLLLLFAATTVSAQFYQRQYQLNFATADFQGVKDIIVEPAGAGITVMADLSSGPAPDFGISLLNYNAGNGNAVSMAVYFSPGAQLSSSTIKKIGTDYFVLGTYTDASFVSRLLLMRIGAGGTVVYARVFDPAVTGGIPIEVIDMDYDGGNYLYATGNVYASADGSSSVFVAKFDLNAALQWFNYYDDLQTEEFAGNIDFYDNNSIYVGAVTAPLASTLTRTGLVLQVNNLGGIAAIQNLAHYTPQPSIRMTTFYAIRANATDVFVAGSTLIGADGSGPMLFAKLDAAGLGVLNYTIYSAPEFFVTETPIALPSKILVAGTVAPTGGSSGYVNAFFDYNTGYLAGSNYVLASSIFSPIRTAVGATGIVYSAADNQSNSKRIYRIKGNAAAASSTCSDNYVFTPQPGPLNTFAFTLGANPVTGTMLAQTINPPVSLPAGNLGACAPQSPTRSAQQEPADVTIYPNPATDAVSINLPEEGNALTIRLIDLNGKVLRTIFNVTGSRVELNTADLPEGIYAVRIETEGLEAQTIRFVKK